MRALKSVLVMAGALKRSSPTVPEDAVLIRAMRDANLPKLLPDDAQLFEAIIGDLFPGVDVPEQVGSWLLHRWHEAAAPPDRCIALLHCTACGLPAVNGTVRNRLELCTAPLAACKHGASSSIRVEDRSGGSITAMISWRCWQEGLS
jgi:hypothetical protein